MPVKLDDAYECLLELLVGKSIAERIDGAVQVAQPVGDVIKHRKYTGLVAFRAEADYQ